MKATTTTFKEMAATTESSKNQASSVMNEIMFILKASVLIGAIILFYTSAWV